MGSTSYLMRYSVSYKCIEGFEINSKNSCIPYCDPNCLECEENLSTYIFECKKCSLNYYKKQIVS